MTLAIMQPYFFPYIGYYQLIRHADVFVVYDNIQFTKAGWIHRNRILNNGIIEYITLPLKKDSDFLNVDQRYLAENFPVQRTKILNRLRNAYHKCPNFDRIFPIVEKCLVSDEVNLFRILRNSLDETLKYMGIQKTIIESSSIKIDHSLKGKYKVLSICRTLGAHIYINPIGGVGLYDKEEFRANDIELQFIKPLLIPYRQTSPEFIPSLSILDVLFNANSAELEALINSYGIL